MANASILASYRQSPLLLDELVNGELWTNMGGLYRLLVERQTATTGQEVTYGFQWLYNTLSGDSTLMSLATGGVWRSLAPPSTATPFIVMVFQAGTDAITMNAYRLLDDLLYQVKVVGPASITSTLVSAAARIDALIGSPPASGSV